MAHFICILINSNNPINQNRRILSNFSIFFHELNKMRSCNLPCITLVLTLKCLSDRCVKNCISKEQEDTEAHLTEISKSRALMKFQAINCEALP